MSCYLQDFTYRVVAPREGRVSRNVPDAASGTGVEVAPREGRVSRNLMWRALMDEKDVAPREGRVSRNIGANYLLTLIFPSRPARGV